MYSYSSHFICAKQAYLSKECLGVWYVWMVFWYEGFNASMEISPSEPKNAVDFEFYNFIEYCQYSLFML